MSMEWEPLRRSLPGPELSGADSCPNPVILLQQPTLPLPDRLVDGLAGSRPHWTVMLVEAEAMARLGDLQALRSEAEAG